MLDRLEVPGAGAEADAVERDPAAGAGDAFVDLQIGLVLGVDPYPFAGWEAGLFEDCQLIERGAAVAGVDDHGESGGFGGFDRRLDEFAIEGMQGAAVDAGFDEPDALAVDAVAGFGDPALGELTGRFCLCVGGQELEFRGAVEAGVGPDFEVGGAGEAAEQSRVAAEEVRRAFEETAAAQGADFL